MSDDINDRSQDDQGKRASRGLFGLFNRRGRDQGLRESIATLVQEAAHPAEDAEDTPELDRQERALIMNVLRLRDITADDVMIPRADIVAMPASLPFQDALDLMRRENHSAFQSIASSSTTSRV